MSIRLNKALRNLNISLKTATDFLLRHKELGEIREEPSFKISTRHCALNLTTQMKQRIILHIFILLRNHFF